MKNNTDSRELAKFDALSDQWWNPRGELGALHDINPVRVDYILKRAPVKGARVIDVGCGGGLLAESMAREGACVTGIDMAPQALRVAKGHLAVSGLTVDYRFGAAESYAGQAAGAFDVVACMELLEHVPDPASLVKACAALAKPDGNIFFATLNRTFVSYVLAILAAEYLLGIVRKKTHEWQKFIRPVELAGWAKEAGLALADLSGLVYIPWVRYCRTGGTPHVNYLAHFKKKVYNTRP